MVYLILGLVCLLPLGGFVLAHRLTAGRLWPSVLAAGAVGAGISAFLATAGSAMATAVDPTTALLRGLGIGFLGGTVIGGLAATFLAVRQARRKRAG